MKQIIALVCSLAALLAACFSVETQAASNTTLNNHVASWVKSAVLVGPAADSETVTISVHLNFRDPAEVAELATAVATPGNSEYGKYWTPDEFRAHFAPEPAHVALVEKTLRNMGLTVGHVAKSGLYIEAEGTVAQLKRAFNVSQNIYAFQGNRLRANAQDPTVPPELAGIVSYIGGLDETGLLRRPQYMRTDAVGSHAAAAHSVVAAKPNTLTPPPVADNLPSSFCDTYWDDKSATLTAGSAAPYASDLPWLICGYTPQQMQQAYGVNDVAENGTGVTVAIVDAFASPTIEADANRYSAIHHLPKLNTTNFSQVLAKGANTAAVDNPCGPQGWFTEESLDVDSVHSMAGNASIVFVGAADCYTIGDYLYDAIDNNVASIITNSWSEGGEYSSPAEMQADNSGFMQAAMQGITVLFSSGDDGDLDQNNGVASSSWPASSPYVLAVGGTSLGLYDASGTKGEWGWGSFRTLFNTPVVAADGSSASTADGNDGFSFYSGAGGGPSLNWYEPSYQVHKVPADLANQTYTDTGEYIPLTPLRRVTPDIALDADPYTGFVFGETFLIAGNAVSDAGCRAFSSTEEYCESDIGGTSLASPLMAGVLALVNQNRASLSLSPVGFVNPALYLLKVGAPGTTTDPIIDVVPPAVPVALLRGYDGDLDKLRLVAVNSIPYAGCADGICEGADDNFNSTAVGFDNVTGLGTPNVPALIKALSSGSAAAARK